MSRKKIQDVTPKQLEVFELLLGYVREHGYQPSLTELGQMVPGGISMPSTLARMAQLVEKGMLTQPPPRRDRCYGFPGLRFLAYQVGDDGNPLPDQSFEVGDCVVTIKKKAAGNPPSAVGTAKPEDSAGTPGKRRKSR